MAMELVYTSAIRGLRPGSSGFCTVAMTRELPPALVPRLESLGGYRPGPGGNGPHAHCFWRVELAGSIAHVLSVVGPAPPDHTQRTNKIASYLVLGPEELAPAGPAWMLSQPGLLRDRWQGEPAWIEAPARVPGPGPVGPLRCDAWGEASGDAGWAGVVASSFLRDQSRPIHVVWSAGMDPLTLVGEVLSLLPDWARWRATFSTYFLQPVAGTPCMLRLCLAGTPAAESARQAKGLVVDLTRRLGAAPDSRFSRMARTGADEPLEHRAPEPGLRSAATEPAEPEAPDEIGLAPDPGGIRPRLGPLPRSAGVAGGPSAHRHPAVMDARFNPMTVRLAITVIGAILLLLALGTVLFVAGRLGQPSPAILPGTVPWIMAGASRPPLGAFRP